ncbi:2-oxo acid dehydrogenase subunit E2 [Rhodococcus oxybenzonivorans]|nr:2-oxo acid dehydrogenase subunit E2 [Rhodococcus oxybenzonivorans]
MNETSGTQQTGTIDTVPDADPVQVLRSSTEHPQRGSTVKLSRLRKVISTRMLESLRVSAQLTTVQEVDVTAVSELRNATKEAFKQVEGISLTYLPFFAKAAVEVLGHFPQLNASVDDAATHVTFHDTVNLGIAVDTPRGLFVPVIRDAQTLTLPELSRSIADIAERVRSNAIKPAELSGSTFTITNIGSAGSLLDTPIINQPEVAILGTGAIRREPKVVVRPDGEETVAIRSVCYLPLTYDHRLIDGADAGRFLAAVKARIETDDFAAALASYEL